MKLFLKIIMPSYISFLGIVEELLHDEGYTRNFKCLINFGQVVGTVVVSSYVFPNMVDSVEVTDLVQIIGTFIYEDGVINVKAFQLSRLENAEAKIRPPTVLIVGEADNGRLFAQQYFGGKKVDFQMPFDVHENTAGKAAKLLEKGKTAFFVGLFVQEKPLMIKV